MKSELDEQFLHGGSIEAADAAVRPVDGDRRMLVEPDQLAAEQRLFASFQQVLLAFGAAHFAGMIEYGFERAVLLQQLARNLRPDQRHARHVVNGIADQRLEVDHLVGTYAPVGFQGRGVVDLIFPHVVNLDAVGNQLPAIFIRRDQVTLASKFVGGARQRGENVVRFVAGQFQQRNPERLHRAANARVLRNQLVRHLGAMYLVIRVQLVAKRRARHVERAKQIGRLLLLHQVQQVSHEAEQPR